MKQTTYSKFFAAAMLGLAIGAAQAGGNDALKKVRESGEYDKIADKYFAK